MVNTKNSSIGSHSLKPLPFVSVIIPTFRDWDRLWLCLDALSRQTYPKSHFEVIVVNNCPDDNPPICDHRDVQITVEYTPGSYAARNKGIEFAKGSIFAFTDSDCQPADDWIETAVGHFLENPQVDFIGGKIDLSFAEDRSNCIELYERAFAFPQHEIRNGRPYSVTANMVTRKTAFQTNGMFDGQSLSGEDVRWGKRAVDSGLTIDYAQQTVVRHPARNTLKEILQKKTRTAGGSYQAMHQKWQVLLVIAIGLIPPLHRYFKIAPDRGITIGQKLIVLMFEYLFRVYRSLLFSLFLLNLKNPKIR